MSLVFVVPRRPTSYAAKTTKEKKSWGILARGCLFSLVRCTRSILWPRAKHTVEPYKHFIPVGALSFTMNGEQSPLMQEKKRRRRRRSPKRRHKIFVCESASRFFYGPAVLFPDAQFRSYCKIQTKIGKSLCPRESRFWQFRKFVQTRAHGDALLRRNNDAPPVRYGPPNIIAVNCA